MTKEVLGNKQQIVVVVSILLDSRKIVKFSKRKYL
jgi:hypothetical protein